MPQNKKNPLLLTQPSPTLNQGRRNPLLLTEDEQGSAGSIVSEVSKPLADTISGIGKDIAPYAQPVLSKLSPVLDVLSRPSYASAKFFDTLTDNSKDFFDATMDAWNELFASKDKQQKLSFSDVIRHRNPEFAANNPKTTTILGFIGDVGLDPTSYLGVGLGKEGIKVGGKVLSKEGAKALAETVAKTGRKAFTAADGTIKLAPKEIITKKVVLPEKLKGTKVATPEGAPLQVYHGTTSVDFDDFKVMDTGSTDLGYGVYFTSNPEIAGKYASGELAARDTNIAGKSRVIPVYLDIKNPFYYDEPPPEWLVDLANKENLYVSKTAGGIYESLKNKILSTVDYNFSEAHKKATEVLKRQGYDGVVANSTNLEYAALHGLDWNDAKEFVVFDPKQVINAITGKSVVTESRFRPKVVAGKERPRIETLDLVENVGFKKAKSQGGRYLDGEKLPLSKGRGVQVESSLKPEEFRDVADYFQAVKERSNEINNLISDVTGQTDEALASQLGKQEVLSDLRRVNKPNDLTSQELRERVETRIQSLASLKPDLFTSNKGAYVKVGLPFGKQRDLFRIAGTDKLGDSIKSINNYLLSAGKFGATLGKVEDTIAGVFNRNYNLPDEYVKLRDDLENQLGYLNDEVIRNTRKLFNNVDAKGRERIGEAMQEIDDQTRNLEQLRKETGGIGEDEALGVIKTVLDRKHLEPQEQALVAQLYQQYKDMATLEMRAELLKNNLINYSPRGYNAIINGDDMTAITRGKYRDVGGPNPYLSSSQQRKYLTNAEAKAAGLDLELDAAVLYANRALASQRALAIKQFKDSVSEIFGTYTPNAKYAHTGILPTGLTKESDLPKRVLDDMRMIGESVMPSGLSESTKNLLKVFDGINRLFKRGATVYRPTFAMRQIPSNTIQAAMISGAKAFKAFDPRSAMDAAAILFNRGKETKQLPEFIRNFLNKSFQGSDAVLAERAVLSHITGEERLQDFASQFYMRNPFGEKINGTELIEEMRQQGIFREFDATGEAFSRKLETEISKDNTRWSAVKELSKFWKHAAMVEDYNRAMLYINGRRLGHSPRESSKLVNKALFDYSRGLSATEKNVIKRLVPFYSFQRFAIPYVLKQTLKQPGNANTIQKLLGTVEKLIVTGEPINPAEQEQFNGTFIFEQPRLFKGFDKDGKATFNILNNLTPYDVLNFMVTDKNGDVDLGRTVEKSVLGALTPFLKVPLEYKYNYNIFTQKTVDEASRLGDLSKIGSVIPQPVKELIGWEDRTNQATGKTATYINPFLAYYSMNFFPVLRDYIKPLDGVDGTLSGAVQAAMNIVMENLNPAKEHKIDLKAQSEFEQLKMKKEVNDLTKSLKSATIKGSKSQAEKDLNDLRNLYKTFQENQKLRTDFQIRGQGIQGQADTEEKQNSIENPTPTITQPIK